MKRRSLIKKYIPLRQAELIHFTQDAKGFFRTAVDESAIAVKASNSFVQYMAVQVHIPSVKAAFKS